MFVGPLVLATFARALDERAKARRREQRKQRQREYRQYLRTEGWKQRRQPALDRARGFCEDCGRRTNLEVHHRTYKRLGAERAEDLVAVCESCHDARHRGRRTTPDWIALALLRRWRIWRYPSTSRDADRLHPPPAGRTVARVGLAPTPEDVPSADPGAPAGQSPRARGFRVGGKTMTDNAESLVCVECGATSHSGHRWKTYLTVDNEPATYCVECARREFPNA